METWYDYRGVWAKRPWMAVIAVLAVAMVVVAVVETVVGGVLAFLFIPGLGLLYLHHLLVQRMME